MPYLAHLWIFWRETEGEEGAEVELRVVLVTEGERVSDNTLEERENFTPLAKSEELDILDKSEILITISGNLVTISDSAQKLVFRPFMENRATLGLRRPPLLLQARWRSPPTVIRWCSTCPCSCRWGRSRRRGGEF